MTDYTADWCARIPPIEVDLALMRRFEGPRPRYTSYPVAERFTESFEAQAYESWLARRNVGGIIRDLALYVHLPLCSTRCFYCGGNTILAREQSNNDTYLKYLAQEIALQSNALNGDHRVNHMHWVGSTSAALTLDDVSELRKRLSSHFDFDADGGYSIEVDTRCADARYVATLRELGFNRISLGIQHFDLDPQQATQPTQTQSETLELIDIARRQGFRSIDVDLIYGLPKQTMLSFERTLDVLIGAGPEHIAIYNYAHIPSRFHPQTQVLEVDLPSNEASLKMLGLSVRRLNAAGYQYIGMECFAKADDPLAVAQRKGLLHLSSRGYSTRAGGDLLALGMSAIGNIGPTYSQNGRTLDNYYDYLNRNTLPVVRGIELSADDLLRRAVIGALMCNSLVTKESLAISYLIDFDRYFVAELSDLREFEAQGLVELDASEIRVTPQGRLLSGHICREFDRYFRQDRQRRTYARVL